MACFHPLKAFRSREVNASGKRGVVFNPNLAVQSEVPFAVPCGQCQGCRVDKGLHWGVRCFHESKMHEQNCFATFSYSPEALPEDYSLRKRDLQLFMKRLREHLWRSGRRKVRALGAGEYGDEGGRPHYHSLLFGFDAPDKYKWRTTDAGNVLYRSELVEKLWPHGHVELGEVTFDSASYVGRYCLKKVNGDRADDHYTRVSPVDGKVHRVEPEFILPSLKPGIGQAWFDRFWRDAFPSDFLMVDGRRITPPPFYLRQYEKLTAASAERVKPADRIRRLRKARAVQPQAKANATPARLAVREEVLRLKLQRLARPVG